jgi:hypothetical protein
VAAGILNRRRPEIHRPMMLLATLTVISAATDRIPAIISLFAHSQCGHQPAPYPIYVQAQISRRLAWFVVNFDETPYFS